MEKEKEEEKKMNKKRTALLAYDQKKVHRIKAVNVGLYSALERRR